MQKATGKSSGKSKFKYRDRDRTTEDINRRGKQMQGGAFDSIVSSSVQMFRPKEGEHTIRIMPRTWDDTEKWDRSWEIKVYVHFGIGADQGTYLCLDKNYGEDCPICEARAQSDDDDERKALAPRLRALAYVIDRNSERAGPMIWNMPPTVAADIHSRINKISDKRGETLLVDDPEAGYDISFERQGSRLTTKYVSIDIEREDSPLSTKAARMEEWLDFIAEHPLPEMLNKFDAEYLEKVLSGQKSSKRDEEEEDDEGDEERGSRRTARNTRAQARRGRDDEEGEEDEDDEQPARSSGRRRLARDPDEDEEGEDEDVKPRGKKRSRDEEEDEDEISADEEEEGAKPARGARGVRHSRDEDEEEDNESEEEDNDETEEEDEEPQRRKSPKGKPTKAEDEDEEGEDEDDEPKTRKKADQVKGKLAKLKSRASK